MTPSPKKQSDEMAAEKFYPKDFAHGVDQNSGPRCGFEVGCDHLRKTHVVLSREDATKLHTILDDVTLGIIGGNHGGIHEALEILNKAMKEGEM